MEPGAAGSVIQPRNGADGDPVQRELSNAGALPCVEPLDQRAIVRRRSGECRAQAFENRPYEPETRRPRAGEASRTRRGALGSSMTSDPSVSARLFRGCHSHVGTGGTLFKMLNRVRADFRPRASESRGRSHGHPLARRRISSARPREEHVEQSEAAIDRPCRCLRSAQHRPKGQYGLVATRLVVARCEVLYTGRLTAKLPEAVRLPMMQEASDR